ncbi:MAG TPA: response regulator transcription factor [Inquilinus sp.]|nr:response regulator transcription factor [Inquilinus sp.]
MKLLIVDDHPVVREGLVALLRQGDPDAVVVEARDSAEGLAMAEQHRDLDVVLLDLAMPGLGGMPAIAEFGRRRPELPVIILSSSEDPQDVRKALAAGALGYVPKSASRQTLFLAVQLVLSGDIYVPPLTMLPLGPSAAGPGGNAVAGARLTQRQLEVLQLLARGLSNKEIGNALDLAEKTVKVHVTAIFRTLNVVNRTQAATAARDAQLI